MIKFGEWFPDQGALENRGAIIAKNVIPRLDGYSPLSDIAVYSSALTARCQGAFAVRDSSNNVNWFAGDASKLYQIVTGTSWTDVSRVGGYSTSDFLNWKFCIFGNRVIATNYNDLIQNFVMGSSSVFADLYANLKARYCAVVKDFVFYAYTNDTVDGERPQRVRWTALNDPTDITVSPTTQSDFQDLVGDGGEITGLITGVAGADVIIVMRNAMWKGTYTGDSLIFRFDKIEGAKGCFVPGSLCQFAGLFFYLAEDGWYMSDGLSSQSIGAEKINKWFFADFMNSKYYLSSSMIDPINQLMIFSYPDNDSGVIANKLLIYNFFVKRFAYGVNNLEYIFPAYTLATSIDDFGATSIDSLPFSLDSGVYAGGVLRLSAFDSSHRMNFMTGATLEATIDTGEAQVTPGKRSFVTEIWPYIDGGTVTVKVGSRNLPTETVSFTSSISVNGIGFAPCRSDARFHRVRLIVAAGGSWGHAQGINPKISGSSWR